MKTAKKKVAKKKAPRRVRVKLKPNQVAELVVPSGHHPVVVSETPAVVEVVPVRKARKKDWFEKLFGY